MGQKHLPTEKQQVLPESLLMLKEAKVKKNSTNAYAGNHLPIGVLVHNL